MCKGDNLKVIQTLRNGLGAQSIGVNIDFNLIMAALEDEKVKASYPKLKALFIELLNGKEFLWRLDLEHEMIKPLLLQWCMLKLERTGHTLKSFPSPL